MLKKKFFGIKLKWFLITPLVGVLFWFFPWLCLFYMVCGLIDVRRHGPFEKSILQQYFLKNGFILWLLSPINLFADLMAWSMKPIYKLNELPEPCQKEINEIIDAAKRAHLIDAIDAQMSHSDRGMMFFKWYGKDLPQSVDVPAFHQKYHYIRTIGVSGFNRFKSTSRHFGPLRLTLRVLYNLNPVRHDGVYIDVYKTRHYWHDNPLFIFDDTFVHQSFNEADQRRYCLFIDIVRPSPFGNLLSLLVSGVQLTALKFNHVFYKKWDMIQNR